MLALGYNEYGELPSFPQLGLGTDYRVTATQGGDIGHVVTRCMGILYPSSCKASHTNMARPHRPEHLKDPAAWDAHKAKLGPREQADEERSEWFANKGKAYHSMQSTKPQTLGYSLADSPVGLLAWIYEKLHDWTDDYQWTADEILTWVSIYWFSTAGPAAAQRIYYESVNDPDKMRYRVDAFVPDVKLGIARFPKELATSPKEWNSSMGPVVFESEHESGGHFAAWEKPEAIVGDLRVMFGKNGGAFGAVSGKTGYRN